MNSLFFRRLSLTIFCLFFTAAIFGCAAGDGDSSDDNDNGGDDGGDNGGDGGKGGGAPGESFVLNTNADDDGIAEATFEILPGTTKLAVTAEANDTNSIRFEEVSDDAGADYLSPGGEMISFASEFFSGSNTVSLPSRDVDPAVSSARTYRVRARIIDGRVQNPSAGTDVNFTINSRADGDLNNGTLLVNLFYVGEVGQSLSSKSAVTSAIADFRRIYSGAGISLRIVEFDVPGPTLLPDPFNGSDFYRAAANLGEFPSVNIFIAGDVEAATGQVLGISGGVPGPPIPGFRSGVIISILTGAGPDGDYDDVEIRLLGESMAHESGHFMGLFHPVDFSGSSVTAVDPLEDTPRCTRTANCEANDTLIRNIMYTSPVSVNGEILPQSFITAQQRGVMNRYVAVN